MRVHWETCGIQKNRVEIASVVGGIPRLIALLALPSIDAQENCCGH
jgi:hypothetical protein